MPTIITKKTQLQSYLNTTLSDKELREAITMLGTDIESFDEEIKVEIFPNRPDMLSTVGLARAVNAFVEKPNTQKYSVTTGKETVHIDASVKDVRPHTRCLIARGLTLTEETLEELIDLQEKLHITYGRNRKKVAIGIYPLEHITLPITYTAQKPEDIVFTPLEMDKQLNAKQLLEVHPTGKKFAHLLEGQDKFPVFRDANNTVLSVPPVLNSQEAGAVTTSTTEVFVEVSGHLPRALEGALRMIGCALIDMGATIESMQIKYSDSTLTTPDLSENTMEVDLEYVLSRSGVPEDKLVHSLAKMGITLDNNIAHIPCYRMDFLHNVDIIEDALIGFGYNNLQATIPEAYTTGKYNSQTREHELIRSILVGLGLQEVMTYTLASSGVKLANPLTKEYSHLRDNIINNLLGVLEKNLSRSYPQHIFEIGTVFTTSNTTETRLTETDHIAIMLCGEEANYTRIRQSVETLTRALQLDVEFEEHEDERFISGRCAKITGDLQGVVGEIHPKELATRGIMQSASAAEFHKK
jgi:phenylalanyl-tRNA synthetase beta chain